VSYRPQAAVDEIHRAYVQKYGCIVKRAAFESWCGDVVLPLLTKRAEFSDEHEHRLILVDMASLQLPMSTRPRIRDRLAITMPIRDLVSDVLLNPLTTDAEAESIETCLREAGLRGTVNRSSLYARPNHDFIVEKPITS